MRKFNPLFAKLQIMELFEFRSCLNLNGFLQSVDSCTTMSWLAREFHRRVRPAITRRFLWADTSVCPYGKYNVIRTFVGAHRRVRPAIARRFLWADTSVCPYGKCNFIRTFVGAHRRVRPAITRCFLCADTSVYTSTIYKKACPCKKSRPRIYKSIKLLLIF